MASTTFNGPVRSENRFPSTTKNALLRSDAVYYKLE